ncbi:hypothetical protein [Arthrobacter sp. 92]|uniref:hypothetical protein n=1 Tax=Arthrobacter sp. 92 TaxID=3418175 RepID=UPI003D08FD40
MDVLGNAGTSTVDQVPSLAQAVNDSVTPVPSRVTTATTSVSGLADSSALPSVQDAAAPVTGAVSAVADTSTVVFSGATDAVSTVVGTTVNTAVGAAAPLVTGAAEVIDPVVGTVLDPVVGTVLPGVPAPPTAPLPLAEPAAEVSGGDPAHLPVGPTDAAAPLSAASDVQAAVRAPAAAPDTAVPSRAAGFTMEQLLRNDFALRGPAEAAVSASPSPVAPRADELLPLAAVQGQSRSGSGSSGPGGGAQSSADLADSWSPLRPGDGTRMPAPAQTVAAGPSFDPGSSPD